MTERERIAASAAERLSRAAASGEIARTTALVGFDGFLDAIVRVVDRHDRGRADGFAPIGSIDALARRIGAAAGLSTSLECHVQEVRFGGNGPLLAGALGRFGAAVTFVGAIGLAENPASPHPAYASFVERCRAVHSVAATARTDALEFDDGKIMLNWPQPLRGVTWGHLVKTLGLTALREMVAASRLVATINWVNMPSVEGIWDGLTRDVLPGMPAERRPRVFIDLSDPARKDDDAVRSMLGAMRRLSGLTPVTLGMNLAEAARIAAVGGAGVLVDATEQIGGDQVAHAAAAIRQSLDIDTVVIHPRHGAAAATRDEPAGHWFDGPFTARPRLSTGAGDHFSAGFVLGQTLGMPLAQSLAVGCASSGAYVRDAQSATVGRLVDMLRLVPLAEE